jgi:hypothetical protein
LAAGEALTHSFERVERTSFVPEIARMRVHHLSTIAASGHAFGVLQ